MTRRRRQLVFLITVLPALIFLVAAVMFVIRQVNRVMAHINVVLVEEIRRQTGRDVTVGRVVVFPTGIAHVYDLRVANGKTFHSGTLLAAREVTVKYRWDDLIHGTVPAIQTVDSVNVQGFTLLIDRLPTGKFNVSDLFVRKPGPRRPPFMGLIEFGAGSVTFRDWLSRVPGAKPAVTLVDGVSGSLDAASVPFYVFDVLGTGRAGKRFGRIAVNGSTNSRTADLNVDVQAAQADAAFWSEYFTNPKAIRVLQGRGDVKLTANRRKVAGKNVWKIICSAKLKNGRASIVGFNRPADSVHGTFKLAGQDITLDMTGDMAGTPFRLTGSVLGFIRPAISLKVTSPSVDFARIAHVVKAPPALSDVVVRGRGPLQLAIVGRSNALTYAARTTVPQVQAYGYRIANMKINTTYLGGVLQVESAALDVLGGHVALGGTVDNRASAGKLALSGTASGIDMSQIQRIRNAGLRGSVSGRFDLTGSIADPILAAYVNVPAGNFNKVAFTKAVADVTVTRGAVTISNMSASAAKGGIRLAGTVAGNKLDLKVTAVGVDLERVFGMLNVTGVSGIGNFKGDVAGSISDPTVFGTAEVFDGRYGGYTFDYAKGKIGANRNQIALDNAIIRVLPAEIKVSGKVSGLAAKNPTVDLTVDVADAPAERLLSELKVAANVTGTVSGHLTVRGSGRTLSADGSVRLIEGSVEGYPVSSAQADVSYAGGAIQVRGLKAQSQEAELMASGTVDRKGHIDFTFAANNVSLARLSDRVKPLATIAGNADVTGKVSGARKNLSASATIDVKKPVINTVQFDEFTAHADYTPSAITAENVSLKGAPGEFAVQKAAYNLEQNSIELTGGRLSSFSYPAIYKMISESPYLASADAEELRNTVARLQRPSGGTVTASFGASGRVDNLSANVQLLAQNIDIAELRGLNFKLDASTKDGAVDIKNFEASSQSLTVRAGGNMKPGGDLDVDIDAYNVDLAAISAAVGPSPVSGTATVSAKVTGPVTSPLVRFDVSMADPIIYGIKFDRLNTGEITVGTDAIDISQVTITRDTQSGGTTVPHSGVIRGTLPWNWASLSIPADKPLNVHASLDEQTLGILSVFTPQVDVSPKRTGGSLSAYLDVTGTLASPSVNGRLIVTDGRVGIVNMQNDFTNLQADLRFSGDTVYVDKLSGASEMNGKAGGTFEAVPFDKSGKDVRLGTVSLVNLFNKSAGVQRGDIDLAIKADSLVIAEQNLAGYNERVTAQVSTDTDGVIITGPVPRPIVSGSLTISQATVLLSAIPENPPKKVYTFRIDPTFNVGFVLGRDVWFNNPTIQALMAGGGRIGGTLSKPDVTASLRIARGWLRFPTQRMRISSGTINVTWAPFANGPQPEAPRVLVDLQAQTSVSATSPLGSRRRYNIILNVQGSLLNLNPQNVGLRSDPPGLSRPQMLAALGHFEDIYGNGELALEQHIKGIFTVAASPYLFGKLESGFIEALGLEDFNIEYGFEQPLAVFVSRKLFDRVYVSYWSIVTGSQSITGTTYSLRVSYRVKDWLEIGYATDSRRVKVLEAAYSKRF